MKTNQHLFNGIHNLLDQVQCPVKDGIADCTQCAFESEMSRHGGCGKETLRSMLPARK